MSTNQKQNNDVFASLFDFTNDMEIISSGDWVIDYSNLQQPLTSSPRPETPDDMPDLIPFETATSTTDGDDDTLGLSKIDQHISSREDLQFISVKLANLEHLITSKLDRYHRMVRRQKNNYHTSRAQTNCPLSRRLPTEPSLVNYGTIIYNEPTSAIPGSDKFIAPANPTNPQNPNVVKWIAKLTPLLETIFEEQSTNLDVDYHDELLGNICDGLSQYAQNLVSERNSAK